MKHARLTLRHWAGALAAALALLALAGILWLSPSAAGEEIPLTPELTTLTAGNTYAVPAGERIVPTGPVTIEEGAVLLVRGELVLEQEVTCGGVLIAEGEGKILQQDRRFTLTGQVNRITVQNFTASFSCESGATAGEVTVLSARLYNSGHIERCTFEAMDADALRNTRFSCSAGSSITSLSFRSCGQVPQLVCAGARIDSLTLLPGDYYFYLGDASTGASAHTSVGVAVVRGEEGARPTLGAVNYVTNPVFDTAISTLYLDGGNFSCPGRSSCAVESAVLLGASQADGLTAETACLAAAGTDQPTLTGGSVGAVYRRVEVGGSASQALALSAPTGRHISGQGDFDGLYCKEGDTLTLTAAGSDPLAITCNGAPLDLVDGSATHTVSAGFDRLEARYLPPLTITATWGGQPGVEGSDYTYDPATRTLTVLKDERTLSGPVLGDVHIQIAEAALNTTFMEVDQGAYSVTLESLDNAGQLMSGTTVSFKGANHLTSCTSEHSGLYLSVPYDGTASLAVDGDISSAWSLQLADFDSVTCQKVIGQEVRILNTALSCTRIEGTDTPMVFVNSNVKASGPVILHSQYKDSWLRVDSSHLNICAVGETPLQTEGELHIGGNSQIFARALPAAGENTPIPAVVAGGGVFLFDGEFADWDPASKEKFFHALSCGGAPAVQTEGEIAFAPENPEATPPTIAQPQGGEVIPLEGGGRTFGVGNQPATEVLVSVEPALYPLKVEGGSGSGSQLIGQPAYLTADPAPEGMVFDRWEVVSGEGTFADATAAETTFTASAAAAVRALYREIPVEPGPDEPVIPGPDDPAPPAPDEPVTPDPPADDTPPAGEGGGQTPPAPEEGGPSGGEDTPPAQGPEDSGSQTGDASALPTWLAILAASLLLAALCKRRSAGWKHLRR